MSDAPQLARLDATLKEVCPHGSLQRLDLQAPSLVRPVPVRLDCGTTRLVMLDFAYNGTYHRGKTHSLRCLMHIVRGLAS